jgi:hypothetical protein
LDNKLEEELDEYDKIMNNYKGNGLECLIEFLIKRGGSKDIAIPINDYKIVSRDEDTGVDGYGIHSGDKKSVTVQVKFKYDPHIILCSNRDHLTNFTSTSYAKYKVELRDEHDHMFIFTTAGGIYYHSLHAQLHGRVTVISRYGRFTINGEDQAGLLQLTDSPGFWSEFREALKTSKSQTPIIQKKEPRLEQENIIKKVMEILLKDTDIGKSLVVSPTGTGKTLDIAEITSRYFEDRRSKNLSHYEEITQKLNLPIQLSEYELRKLAIAMENIKTPKNNIEIDIQLLLNLLRGDN